MNSSIRNGKHKVQSMSQVYCSETLELEETKEDYGTILQNHHSGILHFDKKKYLKNNCFCDTWMVDLWMEGNFWLLKAQQRFSFYKNPYFNPHISVNENFTNER